MSETTVVQPEARKARLTRWQPKKWRPEYERAVAYSCLGLSNKVIAEKLGFTTVHISNILNLPQADELREKILARMREQVVTNIPDVLTKIAEKTALRLKTLVDDDELFAKSPFAIIDRGLEVMKGTGHLKHNGQAGSPTNIDKALFVIPPELASVLALGLNKANEVREIHADESGKLLGE